MEISAQILREVEFREQWRGYSPDEVDEFLEEAAVGVEQLREQLRQANERAVNAERSADHHSVDDVALRDVLVLAQRTADAAVAEARQKAEKIVEEAQLHADNVRAESEERIRRLTEETQGQLRRDLAALEEARVALQADVDALAQYRDQERARLRALLDEQLRRLEGEADPAPPELHAVEIPPPPLPEVEEPPLVVDGPPSSNGVVMIDAEPVTGEHEIVETEPVAGSHAAVGGPPADGEAAGSEQVIDLDAAPSEQRADAAGAAGPGSSSSSTSESVLDARGAVDGSRAIVIDDAELERRRQSVSLATSAESDRFFDQEREPAKTGPRMRWRK